MKTSKMLTMLFVVVATAALCSAVFAAEIPTTNLEFWVRADAGVTKDGSDFVTSWADQTPASTEVAGPNGTFPLWVDNALNGEPIIHFDGNDRLWNNRFATANPIQGTQVTAFVVANRTGAASNASTAIFIQNGQARDYNNVQSFVLAYEGVSNTLLQTYRVGGLSTASNPGLNSPYIFSTVFDGSSNTAYLNGAAQTPVGNSGTFDIDHIVIGQRYDLGFSNGYVGDIAELIVYDRALTAVELNQVGYFLDQKYGIDTAYVPEPSTLMLAAFGLLGLLGWGWRRRRTKDEGRKTKTCLVSLNDEFRG